MMVWRGPPNGAPRQKMVNYEYPSFLLVDYPEYELETTSSVTFFQIQNSPIKKKLTYQPNYL